MPRKSTKNKEESAYQSLTEMETKATRGKKIKNSPKVETEKITETIDQTNLNSPKQITKTKTLQTTTSTFEENTKNKKKGKNKTEATNVVIDSKTEAKKKRKTQLESLESQKPEPNKTKKITASEVDGKTASKEKKKTSKKTQLKSDIATKEVVEKLTIETTKKQITPKKTKEKTQTKEPTKPAFKEKQKKGKKGRPKITKEEPRVERKYEETEEVEVLTTKAKQTPSKPQVRYSDEDLEMFRKRILEVKNEALEELRMLRERLEDLNSYDLAEEGSIYSMHMAEQGSEIAEKEKVYAQIQRINEYIKKLDEALKRIDDKTYGICRVCGILIAKERLLAVPITTLSASYKIHKKCPEDGIDRIEPVAK